MDQAGVGVLGRRNEAQSDIPAGDVVRNGREHDVPGQGQARRAQDKETSFLRLVRQVSDTDGTDERTGVDGDRHELRSHRGVTQIVDHGGQEAREAREADLTADVHDDVTPKCRVLESLDELLPLELGVGGVVRPPGADHKQPLLLGRESPSDPLRDSG